MATVEEMRVEILESRRTELDKLIGNLPCKNCVLYELPNMELPFSEVSRGDQFLTGRDSVSELTAKVIGSCGAVGCNILSSFVPAKVGFVDVENFNAKVEDTDLPQGCPVAVAYKSAITADLNVNTFPVPEFIYPSLIKNRGQLAFRV